MMFFCGENIIFMVKATICGENMIFMVKSAICGDILKKPRDFFFWPKFF
jgi:hypothetical protein